MTTNKTSVKTVSDPKLQGHIDAITTLYNEFATAMDAGNFDEAFSDLDKASDLRKKYPEAWAGALRALDMTPDGTPITD